MCKLLMGQNAAEALRVAGSSGVLGSLFPDLAPMLGFEQGSRYHDLTTDEHTFRALEVAVCVDAPLAVRWALLFHDSGKPYCAWVGTDGRKHYYEPSDKMWATVGVNCSGYGLDGQYSKPRDHELDSADVWSRAARWMNVPNDVRQTVRTLILNHMVSVDKPKQTKVNRERIRLGDETLRMLYMHRMCDLSGKDNKINWTSLANVAELESMRQRSETNNVPAKLNDLAVNGHDVGQLVSDRSQIGRILKALLDEVACDPSELKLSREWQLSRAEALA
jgi:tRNA nucleotidyltransferase (CCA-adding enzyme)